MKFQIFTAALYASLTLASAIPQPAAGGASALEARDVDIDNKPRESWVCPGPKGKSITYSKKDIVAAIEKAVELAQKGEQASYPGEHKYPSPIVAPNTLPGLPEKYAGATNIQHYPMKNGKAFTGARGAKPERVMYLHTGTSDDAEFIGLWTHEGATSGQFVHCREKDD